MDGSPGEIRKIIQKLLSYSVGNFMPPLQQKEKVNGSINLCMESVPNPAILDVRNLTNTLDTLRDIFDFIEGLRLNAIKKAGKYKFA